MYFQSKQKEFQETKNKENSAPFNYEMTSNSSKEIPIKEIMSERTQSPDYEGKETYKFAMSQINPTSKNIRDNTEFQTIKNGINYNACIDALNRIKKSIRKSSKGGTSKLHNSQGSAAKQQKSTKTQKSHTSRIQSGI